MFIFIIFVILVILVLVMIEACNTFLFFLFFSIVYIFRMICYMSFRFVPFQCNTYKHWSHSIYLEYGVRACSCARPRSLVFVYECFCLLICLISFYLFNNIDSEAKIENLLPGKNASQNVFFKKKREQKRVAVSGWFLVVASSFCSCSPSFSSAQCATIISHTNHAAH